ILDEPTEGIQPNIAHEIGDVLLALNREKRITLLLVEQKLPFARRIASDFCVVEKGRCMASGSIRELTDDLVRQHLSVWVSHHSPCLRLASSCGESLNQGW